MKDEGDERRRRAGGKCRIYVFLTGYGPPWLSPGSDRSTTRWQASTCRFMSCSSASHTVEAWSFATPLHVRIVRMSVNPCRHVLTEPGIDQQTTYDVVILICKITNQSSEVAAPSRCERFACACVTNQLFCAWDPHHLCCASDGRPIADGARARIFMAWFAS
jgi:hypothetical protein